jgi:hypothetical protein
MFITSSYASLAFTPILRVFDLLIDPTPGLKADERPGKKGHKLYPAPGQIAELASIESQITVVA